jgi:hypothetical protein
LGATCPRPAWMCCMNLTKSNSIISQSRVHAWSPTSFNKVLVLFCNLCLCLVLCLADMNLD